MHSNFSVVISNYAARGSFGVETLLSQLEGLVDEIVVVVNDDDCKKVESFSRDGVFYIRRPNVGMNIGAWSEAIPHLKHEGVSLFLQDECYVVNKLFRKRYEEIFDNPLVGMAGESINPKWNWPWLSIAQSGLNYPIQIQGGGVISRVNFYLNCMNYWGIDPGANGAHLRALVWAFSSEMLNKLGGFPIGFNKEECIASEIAVSKIVNQLGMTFVQSNDLPFTYFEHHEWSKDGVSKK